MPVESKLIRNRWRTINAKTKKIETNSNGKPIDGGGWPNTPTGQGTATRQVGHVNTPKKRLRPRNT